LDEVKQRGGGLVEEFARERPAKGDLDVQAAV